MIATRVAINGFGRIGRSVFRILHERPDITVVAINDLYDNEQLAYLLRYDTVMGHFPGQVVVDATSMTVDGERIAMMEERDPERLPWKELKVDVVVEASGVFRTRAPLEKHLQAGAGKVVLTVPPKEKLDAMVVIGVNEAILKPTDRLVSNASCTTNCLAPLAKVLHERFTLRTGLLTTVHAYTNDQRLADVPHKNLRRSRAAAENIIPTTTGAARAVGEVLPELAGRLSGMAMRVPVPDGSIVDFVCRVETRPNVAAVNAVMKEAAEGALRGVLEYSEVPLVSSDVIGNPHSSVFDALSTEAREDGWVRVVAWYDNEWGYSNRVVDLIDRLMD